MAFVRDAVPNATLTIVGTGEASPAVKATIRQLHLEECVDFSDSYLPLREALQRVADAHVGLVPNEVSAYTSAMLPVKLTEYATLGIPAVATALPLVKKYFGNDGAEMIERPDPAMIAAALIRLARDPLRRRDVADAARRFTRDHGWSRYARALVFAVGLTPAEAPSLVTPKPDYVLQ
jgi:glycosyltransferase involved in cell wall biosynthesis